ncbi:unnamed protein product [Fusarium graminearum]|nr:unnamed protein product [Fusarium graminearum]
MALPEWKAALSMSQRYETIQKIQDSLSASSMTEAIAIEQAAYQISSTQEEYNLACQPTSTPTPPLSQEVESEIGSGIRIGSYKNCRPVSEGVTSEVYRSADKALKVIVTYQDIEPHNPQREAKILKTLRSPCIPLLETFRDQEQRFVLVFPFMPYTLADVLAQGPLPLDSVRSIFRDILQGLKDIHTQGIIHRDIKPSAILLSSPTGPAYLSDFGTAWHPELSIHSEPADDKILDIGTGPYRAIDVLFGHKSYGPEVDMWGLGIMLSEVLRDPPTPIFESRAVHEDGNQLGLILSIFKTIGTPTPETWPEAKQFKVAPFELWTSFPGQNWEELLPNVHPDFIDLVSSLVRYDSQRLTSTQALEHGALETDIPAGPGPNDSSDSSDSNDSGDSEKPYILAATIPSAAYVQYTNVGDTHVKTTDDDLAVSFKDDIDDFDVDWNVVHRRYIHTPDYEVDNDILTGNNVDGVNTRDPVQSIHIDTGIPLYRRRNYWRRWSAPGSFIPDWSHRRHVIRPHSPPSDNDDDRCYRCSQTFFHPYHLSRHLQNHCPAVKVDSCPRSLLLDDSLPATRWFENPQLLPNSVRGELQEWVRSLYARRLQGADQTGAVERLASELSIGHTIPANRSFTNPQLFPNSVRGELQNWIMSFYPRPMQGVDRTGAVEKLASDDEGDSSVELDEQMNEWLSIDPNMDEEYIATYAPNDISGGETTEVPSDSTDQEMGGVNMKM